MNSEDMKAARQSGQATTHTLWYLIPLSGGDFRRNTQNTFESLVADAENWHYLRIESNKTEDDIKKRVKYMHGDKNVKADKDKTKPLKQAMDTEWRSIMNLDIKYESPDFAYIFA